MKLLINLVFRKIGYELRRLPKPVKVKPAIKQAMYKGKKIYVGCGDDTNPGFIGCDLRKTAAVSIQCRSWELSQYCYALSEIFSRHTLEHLTFKEAILTLQDWNCALREGGKVEIIVPNMEFHIKQWLRAKWDDINFETKMSDANWSSAGFWGWQRECDPTYNDYNNSYWDVHKSGYNEQSISYFLKKVGFKEIETSIYDEYHLRAIAYK